MTCNHIGWLHLSGNEHFNLHYGQGPVNVVQEMTNPERQFPSLVFFIGKKAKNQALREIFPNNNIKRERFDGIVNIRLDSTTISSDSPLLFADADAHAVVPTRLGSIFCHEDKSSPLKWQCQDSTKTLHALYARMVAIFSSVICVFAEDLGGLDNVGDFLVRWIEAGNPSTLPQPVRPRIIIVAKDEEAAITYDILAIESLKERLHNDRTEVFSSVSVVHLAGSHVSSLAQHRRLKEVILSEVEYTRIPRLESRTCFSATHFAALSRRAAEHVAKSNTEPFDLVRNTRIGNELGDDYRDHLSNFLRSGKDFFISYESLASFIASTILMDAYPPRMHSRLFPIAYSRQSLM